MRVKNNSLIDWNSYSNLTVFEFPAKKVTIIKIAEKKMMTILC